MLFTSEKYERKVVCFIDILGFSNIIKKTTNTSDSVKFEFQNIVETPFKYPNLAILL